MKQKYRISIDRGSKSWAIFTDDFQCVKDFTPFTDESAALAEGKAWVADRTDEEPIVVYPSITSIKMTTTRRRK